MNIQIICPSAVILLDPEKGSMYCTHYSGVVLPPVELLKNDIAGILKWYGNSYRRSQLHSDQSYAPIPSVTLNEDTMAIPKNFLVTAVFAKRRSQSRGVPKRQRLHNSFIMALAFISLAIFLFVYNVMFFSDYLTRATLYLLAVGIFSTGILFFTLNRREPVNPDLVNLLPVQGTLEVAALCADRGATGTAWFVPTQSSVTQAIQLSTDPDNGKPIQPHYRNEDTRYLQIVPLGIPLLTLLEKRYSLRLPQEEKNLFTAIQEVCTDTLEVAHQVKLKRDGDRILVDLHRYKLGASCLLVKASSPLSCTMVGCPICSLIACMIAKGTGCACTIESTEVLPNRQLLRIGVAFHKDKPES